MATYDMTTAVGRLAYWTAVLQEFAAGKTIASVSFNSGNGTSQMATYSKGDLPTILQQIRIEQAQVDRDSGLTPKRHALGSGYRPRRYNNSPFYT